MKGGNSAYSVGNGVSGIKQVQIMSPRKPEDEESSRNYNMFVRSTNNIESHQYTNISGQTPGFYFSPRPGIASNNDNSYTAVPQGPYSNFYTHDSAKDDPSTLTDFELLESDPLSNHYFQGKYSHPLPNHLGTSSTSIVSYQGIPSGLRTSSTSIVSYQGIPSGLRTPFQYYSPLRISTDYHNHQQ